MDEPTTTAIAPLTRAEEIRAKRMKNLIPYVKGISGNPKGGRRTFRVRKSIEALMLTRHKIKAGSETYEHSRIQNLLDCMYRKTMKLIPDAGSIEELMTLVPLLVFLRDSVDGRYEQPKVTETASKTTAVFLSSGAKQEHTRTITATQVVEPEGDTDGNNQ